MPIPRPALQTTPSGLANSEPLVPPPSSDFKRFEPTPSDMPLVPPSAHTLLALGVPISFVWLCATCQVSVSLPCFLETTPRLTNSHIQVRLFPLGRTVLLPMDLRPHHRYRRSQYDLNDATVPPVPSNLRLPSSFQKHRTLLGAGIPSIHHSCNCAPTSGSTTKTAKSRPCHLLGQAMNTVTKTYSKNCCFFKCNRNS